MADKSVESPSPPDKDVLIAVMGLTGSGKSSFINLATQSPNKLQVGRSIQSCTDVVVRADPFDLAGRRIVLFDTPGFDNTNKSETEILRLIAFELEKNYHKGQTLHGIIYVHRISDLRAGGLTKTNFGIFRKLCKDSSLRNVVIMTNMWSRLTTEEEGLRRVDELIGLDDFFKPAMAKGAVMVHHKKDTVDSAHGILRRILQNHPMALSIQKEIVDQHKSITETGAGMALDDKLAILAQQYERKLKEQFEAAEEARRERDEETRQEQLEEAEKIRKLLEKLEEERRDQAKQYQLLQEQFAAAEMKHEEATREAEEKFQKEARAAEDRLRQRLDADERRRAQERADMEGRMANIATSFDRPGPRPSVRHGVIVSGQSYAMFNQEHETYYATLHLAQQYERKLKEQLEAAEEARRERDEETRQEQLEEAERVHQLLEKLEEDKHNQAMQYQLLQQQFDDTKRKRERAICDTEGGSRRETQATETGWRQETEVIKRSQVRELGAAERRAMEEVVAAERRAMEEVVAMERRGMEEVVATELRGMEETVAAGRPRANREALLKESQRSSQGTEIKEAAAAGRRRSREKADLGDRTKNTTIASNPASPSAMHGVIVPGRTYTMYNKHHHSYYATLHHNEEDGEYLPLKLLYIV
ncbi:hypothetical protein H1R20_g10782, partial [Candolleomyces eurysporus]